MGEGLSTGQVAEATGLSVHTLRYYEREGLIPRPIARDRRGRRTYSGDDVTWFRVCHSMRSSGMPIAVLRQYVELVQQGPGNEQARLDILERHAQELDQRMAELRSAQDLIAYKTRVYHQQLREGTASGLWSHSLAPSNP